MSDYNVYAMANERLVETPFRQSAKFKIDIEGLSEKLSGGSDRIKEIDLYAKSWGYTPIEVTYEAWYVGHAPVQLPTTTESVGVAIVFREHEDGRVEEWLTEWTDKLAKAGGFFGIPAQEALDVSIIPLDKSLEKVDRKTFLMLPQQVGEVVYDQENQGLLELPVTFMQYRT